MRLRPPPPQRRKQTHHHRHAGLLLLAFLIALVVLLTTWKSHTVLQAATQQDGSSAATRSGSRRGGGASFASGGGGGGAAAAAAGRSIACGAGQTTFLGFDYPELRKTRALVVQLCAAASQRQHTSSERWRQQVAAAYADLLAALDPAHASSSDSVVFSATASSSDNDDARATLRLLQQLLQEAHTLLRAQQDSLLHCHSDASLLAAWRSQQQQKQQQTSFLLAANFHNSAAVLPAFVTQALRLALLLPDAPQHLAVGVYESGSSDTSRLWLTLLHHLLLPLGVAHNITLGGRLSPRSGLGRIELLAALRNAALEPWVAPVAGGGRAADKERPPPPGQQGQQPTAGAAELSYRPPTNSSSSSGGVSALPGSIIYANDVLWCVEDAVRLALHGADIACGMDFYDAPWMAGAAAGGPEGAGSAGAGPGAGPAVAGPALALANHKAPASSDGVLLRGPEQEDDDFFEAQPPGQQPHSSSSSNSSSPGGLRFYDKWVARDAAGHRLVNRPPFITHHPASAAALRAGQPVAMACCWNGLAVLRGRPFAGPRGLRFRAGQPGECRASEASLLCDDFARSGLAHVVMDPGVRLAYELQQVDLLGGTAATAGGGDKAAAAGSGRLQPRLSWQQVVGTSAALAARAAQQQQQQTQTQRYVECCDLLPGRSYVDFRHSCHMVDTAAHNYTADAFA